MRNEGYMKQNIIENYWRPVQIRLTGIWSKTPWSANAGQASTRNDKTLQRTALNTWEDEGGKLPPSAAAKGGG